MFMQFYFRLQCFMGDTEHITMTYLIQQKYASFQSNFIIYLIYTNIYNNSGFVVDQMWYNLESAQYL